MENQNDTVNNWTNENNKLFYESVSPELMHEHAISEGLEFCYDVDQIMQYLAPHHSILEVGAGYGRVVAYLRSHGFRSISTIERSVKCCRWLEELYRSKIDLFFTNDLRKFTAFAEECAFYAALWMWDGITEFAKEEQHKVLEIVVSSLKRKGKLFVDVLSTSQNQDQAVSSSDQHHVISVGDNSIYRYYPTEQEIRSYCQIPIVQDVEVKEYETFTGKKRSLYTITAF